MLRFKDISKLLHVADAVHFGRNESDYDHNCSCLQKLRQSAQNGLRTTGNYAGKNRGPFRDIPVHKECKTQFCLGFPRFI